MVQNLNKEIDMKKGFFYKFFRLEKFEELSHQALKEKINTVRTIYIGIYIFAIAVFLKHDIKSIAMLEFFLVVGLGIVAIVLALVTNLLIDVMDSNIKKSSDS